MTVCCVGWIGLMMGLNMPKMYRLTKYTEWVVHQVGFHLHNYMEMHSQQNIKFQNCLLIFMEPTLWPYWLCSFLFIILVYVIIDFQYLLMSVEYIATNLDLTVRECSKLCSSAASSYVKSSGLSECSWMSSYSILRPLGGGKPKEIFI